MFGFFKKSSFDDDVREFKKFIISDCVQRYKERDMLDEMYAITTGYNENVSAELTLDEEFDNRVKNKSGFPRAFNERDFDNLLENGDIFLRIDSINPSGEIEKIYARYNYYVSTITYVYRNGEEKVVFDMNNDEKFFLDCIKMFKSIYLRK